MNRSSVPLVLVGLISIGCSVTRTVALEDAHRYSNRETVVTMEGYELHWDDGGHLAPAARDGLCLVDAGEATMRVRGEDIPVHLLAGEPGAVCASNRVRKPVSAFVEEDTLTILGRTEGYRVPTRAVVGIRVHGPKSGSGEKVADETAPSGESGGSYRTAVNSVPLIAFGGIVLLGGITGGVVACVTAGETSLDASFERAGFVGLALLGFGAGLGGGIPMIAVGAKQVRLPVRAASDTTGVSLELGLGSAAASFAF